VPESPDPLVTYRWPDPKATDSLEVYIIKPQSVTTSVAASFENLRSLTGNNPNVTVERQRYACGKFDEEA